MTDEEYGKIIQALDVARNRLKEQGMTFNEADQRIRALVNLAVRSEKRTALTSEGERLPPGIGIET